MKQLNEFLEAKGVSTHLKVKRSLAQAFGLPMDNGTEEQQKDLLRALKVGEMAAHGSAVETYRVETAFNSLAPVSFDDYDEALAKQKETSGRGIVTRIVMVKTVEFAL